MEKITEEEITGLQEEQVIEVGSFVPAPDGCLYANVDENHKLIIINQVDAYNQGLPCVEFEIAWNGALYEKDFAPEKPEPTHEEIREMRAMAYQNEVDPITSHISRLRDEEQTEEIVEEIANLIAERAAKVEEIKERFPYPDRQASRDKINELEVA